MITISARDFRGSQGKYLKKALDGSDVILSTRDYGSFRIVPIKEKDRIYDEDELNEMIQDAIDEYNAGETTAYTAEELKKWQSSKAAL